MWASAPTGAGGRTNKFSDHPREGGIEKFRTIRGLVPTGGGTGAGGRTAPPKGKAPLPPLRGTYRRGHIATGNDVDFKFAALCNTPEGKALGWGGVRLASL